VTPEDTRPPIPATCAHRPVVGGLVVPVVNMRLADGGVDFRTRHTAAYENCWQRDLCQVCGNQLTNPAVLFGGPVQLRELRFGEAALCTPCAVYTSRGCPMIAGRMASFATREAVSAGKRGKTCTTPGCDCGGAVPTDPSATGSSGDPAHPWYACYVRPGAWQLTGNKVRYRCTDKGCEHERVVINGALLTAPPLKVVLVSEPGHGRLWRTLTADEVAALIPEQVSA
jgi:hypothetical protein